MLYLAEKTKQKTVRPIHTCYESSLMLHISQKKNVKISGIFAVCLLNNEMKTHLPDRSADSVVTCVDSESTRSW